MTFRELAEDFDASHSRENDDIMVVLSHPLVGMGALLFLFVVLVEALSLLRIMIQV